VVKAVKVPVVSAGSIESYRRISEVWKTGAWGFTIGSALFDKKFAPKGSFRENARAVSDWLDHAGDAEVEKCLKL
jgi:phosphoribosylformimino-5-aminoimidazole carboxamide ribonucleotide (ProFAR) isomerase